MAKEYITEFKDYRDLPFDKEIQDYLFAHHCHGGDNGAIIYSERDVLVLLQMALEGQSKQFKPK